MEADLSATFSGPHRKLPGLFNNLERDQGEGVSIEAFLEAAFNELKQDLRLRSALVYLERREAFELCRQVGEPLGGVAQAMSLSNGALAEVLRHRVYIFGELGADGTPWAQRVATNRHCDRPAHGPGEAPSHGVRVLEAQSRDPPQ